MQHTTVTIFGGAVATSTAGLWVSSGNVMSAYVNGHILEYGFSWTIGGSPLAVPCMVELGFGSAPGSVTKLMEYVLDTYYHPPSTALANFVGGTAKLRTNFRAAIPGGIPIGAGQTFLMARVIDAVGFSAAPVIYPTVVVWPP